MTTDNVTMRFAVNYVDSSGRTLSDPFASLEDAENRVAALAEEFGLDSIVIDREDVSTTEGFSDPQPETTTVTQYAVRVHNNVYDTTWLEMRTEDWDRAAQWADEVGAEDFNEATLVSREVTTTEWAEVTR